MNFLEKLKGVLLSPTAFFESVRDEVGSEALKYYVVFLTVGIIFFGISAYFFGSTFPLAVNPVLLPVLMWVGLFVGLFIGAAIVHLFARLFGGKGDYSQTYKALAYGLTPNILLLAVNNVFQLVSPLIGLWSLILQVIGLAKLHEVSYLRALAMLIVPGIVIGLILSVIVSIIFSLIFLAMLSAIAH
ncbi:MAG: YIP1 family protein [Candidatus Micrarchaeota archaeon]|nr:YIP1 family protein [Candidatus Micrarchaeota archaeon]